MRKTIQEEYGYLVNRPNTGVIYAVQDGIIIKSHVSSTLEGVALDERPTLSRTSRRGSESLGNSDTKNIASTETVNFDE